jgi:uncharacterized protein YqfB (UPF0267 family)
MKIRRLISIIITISLSLLLTSCHTEYISLDYKIIHGAMWNNNQTKIAFFVSKKAYRAPKGISRFPDGGISKTVYSEAGLYVFDPENKYLYEALTFKSFPSSKSIKIAYTDSMIYYIFLIDWDYRLHFAKTEADSLKIYRLREEYARPFVFNEKTKETTNVDTSTFLNVYKEDNEVDYMTLHNRISEVPLSELGLVIKEIYPKSDADYINDFIYSSKGGSRLTKRAIAEQIISKLSEEEIRNILKRIDEYRNSLDGLERKTFEFNSEDKYELLKRLL